MAMRLHFHLPRLILGMMNLCRAIPCTVAENRYLLMIWGWKLMRIRHGVVCCPIKTEAKTKTFAFGENPLGRWQTGPYSILKTTFPTIGNPTVLRREWINRKLNFGAPLIMAAEATIFILGMAMWWRFMPTCKKVRSQVV